MTVNPDRMGSLIGEALVRNRNENVAIECLERAMSIGLSLLRDLDTARGQVRLMQRTGTSWGTECPAQANAFDTAVTAAFIACKNLVPHDDPEPDGNGGRRIFQQS